LFSPNDNAERLTAAAEGTRAFSCSSIACWSTAGGSPVRFRGGSRGGKDGLALVDRGSWSARMGGGDIFVELDGALNAYLGLSNEYCGFEGSWPLSGSGGSSASPQAGALTLLAESFDLVLAILTRLVSLEYVEPPETAEEFDSTESLLISCPEGRRNGKGGGGKEGCLVGSGGGGGLACFVLLPEGRMMVGGGSSPFCLSPFG